MVRVAARAATPLRRRKSNRTSEENWNCAAHRPRGTAFCLATRRLQFDVHFQLRVGHGRSLSGLNSTVAGSNPSFDKRKYPRRLAGTERRARDREALRPAAGRGRFERPSRRSWDRCPPRHIPVNRHAFDG